MTKALVYSSKTGNTAILAKTIRKKVGAEALVYSGSPTSLGEKADFIFVGFWTDKGSCDPEIATFLNKLHGKKVFLFGTAGFGGTRAYFNQILARVRTCLDASNEVVGTYMCQGKMPDTVRAKYELMQKDNPEQIQYLLDNFEEARSHPDSDDLEALEQVLETMLL